MRKFFYRLTWDKEFRNKTLLIAGSVACFVVICVFAFPICSQAIIDMTREENIEGEEQIDEGSKFSLQFADKPQKSEDTGSCDDSGKNDNKQENNDNGGSSQSSQESSGNSSGGSTGGGESGGGSSGGGSAHIHSWHTVVDQAAWTETVRVQVGCSYRCNNCGFTTNNSGTMSSHCSQYSHSFSSSPIYEERQVYHAGSSHEECSCGARR